MITKRCIEMGLKVIILEKPLANNIKEAKKLINIIKKKGKSFSQPQKTI